MTITIKDLPSRRLAVMEHHGDPMKLSITLDKLISWAKAQPINLKPKAGEAFGYGYADPRETPPEELKSGCCFVKNIFLCHVLFVAFIDILRTC